MKKINPLLIRYGILFLFIILIIPLTELFFSHITPLRQRFDYLYHTQRIYLILGIALIIFYLIAKDKYLKLKVKPRINWLILAISLIIFAIISSNQISFFDALENGLVEVKDGWIYWDRAGLLGTAWHAEESSLSNASVVLRREITLYSIPDEGIIYWYGLWKNPVNYQFVNTTQILLYVNNYEHDITSQFSSINTYKQELMSIKIPKNELNIGNNYLQFKVKKDNLSPMEIIFLRNIYYYEKKSEISYDGGKIFSPDHNVILAGIKSGKRIPSFREFLFLYKPFIVIIGFVLLILGIFGISFTISLFRKTDIELYSSLAIALGFFASLRIIEQSWKLMALPAIYIANLFAKLTFSKTVFITQGVPCPVFGVQELTFKVCDLCSGYESLSLFMLLSVIILVTNWAYLDKWKTIFFFIIGALGTVLVNAIRLYAILLMGVFVSTDAMNIFHLNAGWILFLIYSSAFWLLLLPYIKK
jgi:exosortase/archaeosortase family protein